MMRTSTPHLTSRRAIGTSPGVFTPFDGVHEAGSSPFIVHGDKQQMNSSAFERRAAMSRGTRSQVGASNDNGLRVVR